MVLDVHFLYLTEQQTNNGIINAKTNLPAITSLVFKELVENQSGEKKISVGDQHRIEVRYFLSSVLLYLYQFACLPNKSISLSL